MSYSGIGAMYATAGLGASAVEYGGGARKVALPASRAIVIPNVGRMGPRGYAPPWRPSGFHSFQGLGRYVERPGFHYEYATAGLGAETGEAVTKTVRQLQQLLLQKGFSVGSSGADGTWGSRTRGALERALGRQVEMSIQIAGSRGSQTIRMPYAWWVELASKPDRPISAPSTAPEPTTTIGPSTLPGGEEPYLDAGGTDWGRMVPYALGATALLALGGYFLWTGKKARRRRVAANRRRRRRSSRRRR